MAEKLKAAVRLRDRMINSQYTKLLKKFVRIADNDKNSYIELVSTLSEYTKQKLEIEGFIIEGIELYEDKYKAWKISW